MLASSLRSLYFPIFPQRQKWAICAVRFTDAKFHRAYFTRSVYFIVKGIMKNPTEQLKRKFLLDPIHDSRHFLRDDPHARESLVFMLQLPEQDIAAFVYTWVNGESKAGAAFCAYGPGVGGDPIFEVVDGIPVPREQGFNDWRVGKVHVAHGAALQVADLSYAGENVSLEYHFEASHPAYNYGSNVGGCPDWLADDRFEQAGRVRGVLRLGEREIAFDTMGHRDHSWGTRDWGVAQHWKWLEAQTGPDTSVHFYDIQALGRNILRGYVQRDGEIAEVTAVDVTFQHDDKLRHTGMQAVVLDELGRSTRVTGTTYALFEFPVSPLATLNEGSMTVEIDGVKGVGHVEMCWPKSYLDYIGKSSKI